MKASLPENDYVARALDDLRSDVADFAIHRPLTSIFIGGGTPSLFSGQAIARLLDGVRACVDFAPDIEITLEANPGTVDEAHFRDYFRAGVNRLSIGVQSFHAAQLKKLGRIHTPDEARRAVKLAQDIGFDNINIDIMFGLPSQSQDEALADVDQAISLNTEHLSYYQLTLEPNTVFAKHPPALPDENRIDDGFEAAAKRLRQAGFARYEVSAWTRGRQARHNRNYWEHGDYLGIGAGAHGKLTLVDAGAARIVRTTKPRAPKHYLQQPSHALSIAPPFRDIREVEEHDKAFEFMLNALRLADGFNPRWMAERGLFSPETALPTLQQLADKGLLQLSPTRIRPTPLGYRFVNEMVEAFLDYSAEILTKSP